MVISARPAARLNIIGWVLVFFCGTAFAQDITGSWRGNLSTAFLPTHNNSGIAIARGSHQDVNSTAEQRGMQIIVKLSSGGRGELTGELYNASSVATEFPLWAVSFDGSRLSFTIHIISTGSQTPNVSISFTGTLSADHNSIVGWFQGAPLMLERVTHVQNTLPSGAEAAVAARPEGAAPAASTVDSSSLLTRALGKLSGTTSRLLKYTCLEKVERAYYSDPSPKLSPNFMTETPADSCERKTFSDGNLILDAEDRLRLEVAVSGGKEIHSWPQARRFESRSVFEMILNGPVLTGAFGTFVVDIFENPGAKYRFVGVKKDGRFEWAFGVPEQASHYSVKAGNDWKITGYTGSFEIDATTAELVRLMIETANLPQTSGMCRARTDTVYHYEQIGNGRFLIPAKTQLDTLSPNQSETRNVITFSACREFTAESSLLNGHEGLLVESKTPSPTAKPFPGGVALTLALTNQIDTRSAAAGDPINAKIIDAVRAPGSKLILAPAGAIARGRILQVRHQYRSAEFQILINFDILDSNGVASPLAVRLIHDLKAAKKRTTDTLANQGTEFSLPPPSGEPAGWFAFPDGDGFYVMRAGAQSKWLTVAP